MASRYTLPRPKKPTMLLLFGTGMLNGAIPYLGSPNGPCVVTLVTNVMVLMMLLYSAQAPMVPETSLINSEEPSLIYITRLQMDQIIQELLLFNYYIKVAELIILVATLSVLNYNSFNSFLHQVCPLILLKNYISSLLIQVF